MSSDEELKPEIKYKPTEQSLDLAERIALAQGQEFDREATRALGSKLFEVMFDDLVRVLELEEELKFQSGVYRFARAFSAKTKKGTPTVVLDMVFDHCLFSLAHLISILAFSLPSPNERRRIAGDIERLFELFTYSAGFEDSKSRMLYYLLEPDYNQEILNFATLLSRAMIVFVLCHEISHVRLGHLQRSDNDPDLELHADEAASKLFWKVLEYGETNNDTHIHVDPKLSSSPIVLCMIFELYEAWLQRTHGELLETSSHPAASTRTAQLQNLMSDRFNDPSLQIVVGFTEAIRDAGKSLGLPEL